MEPTVIHEQYKEEHAEHEHETIIKLEDVVMDFSVGRATVNALKGVNLEVRATDFIVIFGPSGCGKSTLFNIILGLEEPSYGQVTVRDENIYAMDEDVRARYREEKFGMIYQMPYWINSLNVLDNVSLPLIIEGAKADVARTRAENVLKDIGIADLAYQIPTQLSGGQQQKAGLARALVSNPWIIMADEPTGNLDSESGDQMMAYLQELNEAHKRTVLMVTHNKNYWNCGTRRIEMKDGLIVQDTEYKKS